MKLYDENIKSVLEYLNKFPKKTYAGSKKNIEVSEWKIFEKEELVLRSEMAFELGGGEFEAVSTLAFTLDKELVKKSEVIVIGPDLPDIEKDCSYARITLIRLCTDISEVQEDTLYKSLRKVDYVRYHVHPEGYMMRISSLKEREPVRIAESAMDSGITFEKIGRCFNEAYEKQPEVEAAVTYFITLPQVDYHFLKNKAHSCEQITDSLNHIYENLKMDCSVCGLKEVCDEVEGLRKLHLQITEHK